MDNGWESSAQAWIDSIGERGDWGRQHVLDPAMMARVAEDSATRLTLAAARDVFAGCSRPPA
jgi:hypothetical protein